MSKELNLHQNYLDFIQNNQLDKNCRTSLKSLYDQAAFGGGSEVTNNWLKQRPAHENPNPMKVGYSEKK